MKCFVGHGDLSHKDNVFHVRSDNACYPRLIRECSVQWRTGNVELAN